MKSAREQAEEIKSLSMEEKQKLLDQALESEDKEEGNTSLFNLANMDELKPLLEELTPMAMFERSVALNFTTTANLQDLLPRLSKKNLIKLFFATLKLPEGNASLSFGGSANDKKLCEMSYAQAQLARNAMVHVLGTTAIAQARLYKAKLEKEKQEKEQEAIDE